jgi:hypothetical protein
LGLSQILIENQNLSTSSACQAADPDIPILKEAKAEYAKLK